MPTRVADAENHMRLPDTIPSSVIINARASRAGPTCSVKPGNDDPPLALQSLHDDLGGVDHRSPCFETWPDQIAHLVRRARERLGFQRADARAQFGVLESVRDRPRYFRGDLLGRTGGRRDRHPGVGIDARQRLRDRGDARVILEPLAAAGSKQFELAGVYVRLVGEEIIRDDNDISAEQIVDSRGRARTRDGRHAELALEHQELAEEMAGLAFALMPVIDLARI